VEVEGSSGDEWDEIRIAPPSRSAARLTPPPLLERTTHDQNSVPPITRSEAEQVLKGPVSTLEQSPTAMHPPPPHFDLRDGSESAAGEAVPLATHPVDVSGGGGLVSDGGAGEDSTDEEELRCNPPLQINLIALSAALEFSKRTHTPPPVIPTDPPLESAQPGCGYATSTGGGVESVRTSMLASLDSERGGRSAPLT
jgi:hypothetical protein